MSASTLESRLEALQCHFTWDLDPSRSKLLRLRDNLQDIGTDEGYSWLGHIYNLQGFVHHQLGLPHDALRFLGMATEAFRQIRNTVPDAGPWLVVNYGNLSWLHYCLRETAQSLFYLAEVDALMSEYPSPSPEELHPEVCAEKAWSLMKFSMEKKLLAADYFRRAVRMQPDVVEWQTGLVLVLVQVSEHWNKNQKVDVLEKMKLAREHDPENLYLAALYLEACAQSGRQIAEEARELARRVLRKPVSSYSGIDPILRLYRMYLSMDEAIDLAEEALERHPGERYLKRCAAICYKMKIFSQSKSVLEHSMLDRAISLYQEVIAAYPESSLKMKTTLANIYAKSDRPIRGDQMFQELLGGKDLEPEELQMLNNRYARYLHFSQRQREALRYHMEAARIPHQSFYSEDSVRSLEKRRHEDATVEEFLRHLRR